MNRLTKRIGMFTAPAAALSAVLVLSYQLTRPPPRDRVQIITTLADGQTFEGWGINLDGRRVLLPRHLIHGAVDAVITIDPGRDIALSGVSWESPTQDLAIAVASRHIGAARQLSSEELTEGSEVWISGVDRLDQPALRVAVAGAGFGPDDVYVVAGGDWQPGDSGTLLVDCHGNGLAMANLDLGHGVLAIDIRRAARGEGYDQAVGWIERARQREQAPLQGDRFYAVISSSEDSGAVVQGLQDQSWDSYGDAVLFRLLYESAFQNSERVKLNQQILLERWPDNTVALFFCCRTSYAARDWDRVRDLVAKAPEGADLTLLRAVAAFVDGQYENCISLTNRAIKLGTEEAHAYLWRGAALIRVQREYDAIASLEYASWLASSSGDEWCRLEAQMWLDGDYDSSLLP